MGRISAKASHGSRENKKAMKQAARFIWGALALILQELTVDNAGTPLWKKWSKMKEWVDCD